MQRLSLVLVPIIAALAAMFGVFYVINSIPVFRRGETQAGVILLVFGLAGIALGTALWRSRRLLLRANGES